MKTSKVTLARTGTVAMMFKTHVVAAGLIIFSPFATAVDQPEQQPQASNLTYVGSNGRIGVGYDTKTKLRGEVYWIFSEEDLAAWIGEGWGSGSAGGLKLNYQWIAGGEQEKAADQSVRKLFAAVDQNDQHDQKFTLGGGLEHENLFLGAYVSAALSGRRTISDNTSNVSDTVFGTEQDGRQYSRDVFTTTRLRLYERPYDYGVGARAGRYFNEPLIRLSGGLDYEWGRDSNHQTTLSVILEKFIANSPHSFSVNAEAHQKSGALEQNRHDQRLYFMYRYELGGKSYRPERESRLAEASANAVQPATSSARSVEIAAGAAEMSAGTAEAAAGVVENKPKIEKRMVKTTAAMLSDAFFEFDSAKLTPEAKAALESVIATINKAGYSGNIHLTGHTCNVGAARQNLKLSERRALSVKKFLVETGKIDPETIIAEGKGEDNPRYPNVKDSRHKNRRVDLEFVTFTEKLEDVELPFEPAQAETSTSTSTSTSASTPTSASTSTSTTTPTKPAQVEWAREYIDTEPAWLRRALHNTVSHKQSVDVYRQQEREVNVTSSEKHYINRAPSAQNEAFLVNSGETALLDVLANDSDPDQDLLQITSVTLPAHGIASVSGNKISYTPAPGFIGLDNFSYTITDDKGATSTAQVTVTVSAINRTPVAAGDTFSVPSSRPSVLNVLANDSDPDGDTLTIESFTQPGVGLISRGNNGDLVFSPSGVFPWNHFASATFNYTISDGKGGTSTAIVTLIDP